MEIFTYTETIVKSPCRFLKIDVVWSITIYGKIQFAGPIYICTPHDLIRKLEIYKYRIVVVTKYKLN